MWGGAQRLSAGVHHRAVTPGLFVLAARMHVCVYVCLGVDSDSNACS